MAGSDGNLDSVGNDNFGLYPFKGFGDELDVYDERQDIRFALGVDSERAYADAYDAAASLLDDSGVPRYGRGERRGVCCIYSSYGIPMQDERGVFGALYLAVPLPGKVEVSAGAVDLDDPDNLNTIIVADLRKYLTALEPSGVLEMGIIQLRFVPTGYGWNSPYERVLGVASAGDEDEDPRLTLSTEMHRRFGSDQYVNQSTAFYGFARLIERFQQGAAYDEREHNDLGVEIAHRIDDEAVRIGVVNRIAFMLSQNRLITAGLTIGLCLLAIGAIHKDLDETDRQDESMSMPTEQLQASLLINDLLVSTQDIRTTFMSALEAHTGTGTNEAGRPILQAGHRSGPGVFVQYEYEPTVANSQLYGDLSEGWRLQEVSAELGNGTRMAVTVEWDAGFVYVTLAPKDEHLQIATVPLDAQGVQHQDVMVLIEALGILDQVRPKA